MQDVFPKKAIHGGRIREFHRKSGSRILDVSASMNPFVPEISCDFSGVELGVYPDDSYTVLKEALGRVFSRDPAEICVGNGSAELIRVYCSVVLEKGDSVRIDPPTFGEYRLSAELAGASFQGPARVRFLCNPNNPTGILLSREEVLSELARCREEGTQLFLDEAFMDLSEPAASVSGVRDDHLFVLRSLTKAFSVPGIRFGYGFGPPDLIEKIETARTPWTVNAFAEQYAVAAFSRYDALRESAQKIAAERKWFCAELDALGLSYGKSSVNYLLIGVNGDAAAFSGRMLSHGVLVRDCTSFGLPASIRVSIGTRDVNRQVLEALSSCLR